MNVFHKICFLALLGMSQAWWFFNRNNDELQPQTGVEPACEEAGRDGSCEIYECLQRRFPCDGHNFAENHGFNYCLRYRQHMNLFNQPGQEWVQRSQICLTSAVLDLYNLPSTTCQSLNQVGWDRMSSCYVREGFCSIAWDNREALWAIFQARDLRHTIRIWREILEIAVGCSELQLTRFTDWGRHKITDLLKR